MIQRNIHHMEQLNVTILKDDDVGDDDTTVTVSVTVTVIVYHSTVAALY